MKKLIKLTPVFFLFFFFLSSFTIAQQPAWVDYAKRTSMYPSTDYLVGFVSGINNSNEDPGKLMDRYEELAKSKVIQSIQVSIETNNSLSLSNANGKSGEEFQSKSVSFSSATITGLKTERYYNSKKKEVFAFSYASKQELGYYGRKLISTNLKKIEQKLLEGREQLKINDMENALISFYEGMPLLTEAEEAQWLLMAINREQFVEKDIQKIRDIKRELNKEISKLQHSNTLNISEAAYFIAYGLFVQLSEIYNPIAVSLCTYENTELPSDFSKQFDAELKSALVKTGKYKLQDDSSIYNNAYLLNGKYWEEGDQLRVHVQVIRNNKLEAVAEGNISLSWLKGEHLKYFPSQLEKIEQLQNLKLIVTHAPELIKIGRQSDQPIEVKVEKIEVNERIPAENIPILISTKKGKKIASGISNENGFVNIYFPAISLPEGKTDLYAQIDLAAYADIDTSSAFYSRIRKNNPVSPAILNADLVPLVYYINSNETIDNKPLAIKIVEPEFKNALADRDYKFANTMEGADFEINIKATTTSGNTYQGIYFSYVDATVSVIDLSTGLEVFKTSVEQTKGGGSNSKKAGIKALNLASDHLKEKMINYLSSR
jgi:hypothetical protein